MIMIEVNGAGGFYGEIGRTWCLGEPSKDLLHCWDVALEGQHLLADMSKPERPHRKYLRLTIIF